MKAKLLLLAILFISTASQVVTAQLGFSHEIGVIAGPVAFQSDFGQRNDFDTNKGNVGVGIGLVHYLNFAYRADCNCYSRDTYFNDHFKVRNEIDFHKTKLNHFGDWITSGGEESNDLRDHYGSTSVFEIGTHLEYFPLSIRDFTAGAYLFAPYISLGVHFVSFQPEALSRQGPIGISETTLEQFLVGDGKYGGIDDSASSTWAVAGSLGARYKLGYLADLVIDLRWHYYASDWVDGLNPDTSVQPSNRANDWMFWINVGYIYYLD